MFHFAVRLTFVIGLIIGVLLAVLTVHLKDNYIDNNKFVQPVPFGKLYEEWFANSGFKRHKISLDEAIYDEANRYLESQLLKNRITIVCILLKQQEEYTKVAYLTWAKQCTSVITVDMVKEKKILPVIGDKHKSHWSLLCRQLKRVPSNFSWVLVVQDDTTVMMENLRYMLGGLNASKPFYLGHTVSFWGIIYNTGRAGYVLSSGSLNKFKESGINCQLTKSVWAEDLYLGKELSRLNITPVDTRDENGLSTFQGDHLMKILNPSYAFTGFYKNSVYSFKCCSPHSVTIKTSGKHGAYAYYYYTTKLMPFLKGKFGNKPYNIPVLEDKVVRGVLEYYGDERKSVSREEYYDFWVKLLGTYGIHTEDDNE